MQVLPLSDFQRETSRGRAYVRSLCRSCRIRQQKNRLHALSPITEDGRFQTDLGPVTDLEREVNAGAACKGDLRFTQRPPGGRNLEQRWWQPLRDVCASCPVMEKCREWGDQFETETWAFMGRWTRGEHLGTFLAGETARERLERRRGEREEAA